jgi:hypothetical protein
MEQTWALHLEVQFLSSTRMDTGRNFPCDEQSEQLFEMKYTTNSELQ